MRKLLRVALVWNGTVMAEKTFASGSVTLGNGKDASFPLPVGDGSTSHVLFVVDQGSARVQLGKEMTGTATIGGNSTAIQASGQTVKPGDYGVIQAGEVTFFFQWVDEGAAIVTGGALGIINYNLLSFFLISLVAHLGFVFYVSLMWNPGMKSGDFVIPDRFVRIMVNEPPDVIEEIIEEDAPDDETTSKAAGGEEGRFGDEDAEVEDSVLPNYDGPMRDSIQSTELGASMSAAMGISGQMSDIFGSSDSFANTFGDDFATAGEGDVLIVGRGHGGMGRTGTGSGGGGDGLGRVHGVGNIDTGGGRGQGASVGRRAAAAPRAAVSRGEPRLNGFLSREQIERVVRRHERGIRTCYERQLINDPSLAGRVNVNWTIGLDGRVQSASVTENSMSNREIESCIIREVRRMQFDQPDGGIVVVAYPFTFRAGN